VANQLRGRGRWCKNMGINTIERLVVTKKPSPGYTKLVEAFRDLAFEALVLRYPNSFGSAAIDVAKRRIAQEASASSST
jgi:hypothetical protein